MEKERVFTGPYSKYLPKSYQAAWGAWGNELTMQSEGKELFVSYSYTERGEGSYRRPDSLFFASPIRPNEREKDRLIVSITITKSASFQEYFIPQIKVEELPWAEYEFQDIPLHKDNVEAFFLHTTLVQVGAIIRDTLQTIWDEAQILSINTVRKAYIKQSWAKAIKIIRRGFKGKIFQDTIENLCTQAYNEHFEELKLALEESRTNHFTLPKILGDTNRLGLSNDTGVPMKLNSKQVDVSLAWENLETRKRESILALHNGDIQKTYAAAYFAGPDYSGLQIQCITTLLGLIRELAPPDKDGIQAVLPSIKIPAEDFLDRMNFNLRNEKARVRKKDDVKNALMSLSTLQLVSAIGKKKKKGIKEQEEELDLSFESSGFFIFRPTHNGSAGLWYFEGLSALQVLSKENQPDRRIPLAGFQYIAQESEARDLEPLTKLLWKLSIYRAFDHTKELSLQTREFLLAYGKGTERDHANRRREIFSKALDVSGIGSATIKGEMLFFSPSEPEPKQGKI